MGQWTEWLVERDRGWGMGGVGELCAHFLGLHPSSACQKCDSERVAPSLQAVLPSLQ